MKPNKANVLVWMNLFIIWSSLISVEDGFILKPWFYSDVKSRIVGVPWWKSAKICAEKYEKCLKSLIV